jgi:hypothetical protein
MVAAAVGPGDGDEAGEQRRGVYEWSGGVCGAEEASRGVGLSFYATSKVSTPASG